RRARRAPGLRHLRARPAGSPLARLHVRDLRGEGRAAAQIQPGVPRSSRPALTKVVVVGAGFAGLAAAEARAAGGADVTVLEARDRVGGRVHSQRIDNDAVVELGAEFVLPG